uniref:Uncharacterized protein n=1 Tax=Arundo donax TaxID=35708 RepID=A0A0A9BZD8_ARUDO
MSHNSQGDVLVTHGVSVISCISAVCPWVSYRL